MSTITKDKEFELSNGRLVAVQIEVEGIFDSHYGSDEVLRTIGRWLIDSHSYSVGADDELDESEVLELEEKIEEFVYEEVWDFEAAENETEMDESEDGF